MSKILGIDTSNYTTSVSLLDTESMTVVQKKMLLPVKQGEKGIRQSEAVFHHTQQLPVVMNQLFEECGRCVPDGIGVSVTPRLVKGSYMPCFTVGSGFAGSFGAVTGILPDKTSHQTGHILAGLYSCRKLDLLKSDKPFMAFHASGGTTDLLLCRPDTETVIDVTEIGHSLDLKAGQAVDRVGVMLGMAFPCGKELDKLACKSNKKYRIKPSVKGMSCCLSGVENKCREMYDRNEPEEDTAKYCIDYLIESFSGMLCNARKEYGNIPLVCVGGVMSNTMINAYISQRFNAYFAEPEFSCDNAVGTAVYSALKKGMI
ncbi:MAG: peptidase M22 [Oscillospiraceae bacterium]